MYESRYNLIISKIKAARESDNKRSLTLWKNKLSKWQREYGAYQPIK
jgi:hypothetical protein